ncbi:FAD-binding protein [Dactylosporangium sp. NPDC049140]|uniref:FAD-binding oxidoreductase n=1 Tax=Dactylosporangium sp. NPDC049140 TaxID=3155647 RepID=UPI0033D8B141
MSHTASPLPEVRGTWVMPGDAAFEDAVFGRVFNARRPDRRPAAVLLAADAEDVVAGVRTARERGWQVSVRSGGHSWAVWSVRDDALLIDLGGLRSMAYDDATAVVVAGPAVRGGTDLGPFLEARGRFFSGGHCPTVGIGGFLLQGGQGYLARGWGWAAENVVAVDVVTADGELIPADATRNTDLLWAARGAGPGFPGVVVAFHLQTRSMPPVVVESVELYPLDYYADVMSWLQRVHGTVSPDVEIVALAMTPPRPVPGHPGGHLLAVTGLALAETREEADRALAPLWTSPLADQAHLRAVTEHPDLGPQRAAQFVANPEGHRYRADSAWLDGTPEAVVPALRRTFTELPTPKSYAIWFSMAPLRELPDMACSLQSEIYQATYVIYEDAADDEPLRDWLTARTAELQPVTVGQYLGDSDPAHRELKVLGDAQFARLQEIRAARDPDRLFTGYLAQGADPTNVNHWL